MTNADDAQISVNNHSGTVDGKTRFGVNISIACDAVAAEASSESQ